MQYNILLSEDTGIYKHGKRFIQLQIKHSLQHWHIFLPF